MATHIYICKKNVSKKSYRKRKRVNSRKSKREINWRQIFTKGKAYKVVVIEAPWRDSAWDYYLEDNYLKTVKMEPRRFNKLFRRFV